MQIPWIAKAIADGSDGGVSAQTVFVLFKAGLNDCLSSDDRDTRAKAGGWMGQAMITSEGDLTRDAKSWLSALPEEMIEAAEKNPLNTPQVQEELKTLRRT